MRNWNARLPIILLVLLSCAFIPGTGRATTGEQCQTCIPAYAPRPVSISKSAGYLLPDGSVRVVGVEDLKGIVTRLNDLFTRTHPGIRFTYVKSDSLAAIYSLMFDSSAFAPVAVKYPSSLTYTDIVHGPPFSIRIAHESLKPVARFSPLVVIVNPANPLSKLSMGQLAAIFTQTMRQPVLSHWSQLGAAGMSEQNDIHPCGLPWSDHYPSEDTNFGDFVFFRKLSAAPPVENYRMMPTYAEVVQRVSADRGAIGIARANSVNSSVKVLGIVAGPFGRATHATTADIQSGSYPLERPLRIYGRVVSGKPLDSLVGEYMRMVLSREGQQIISEDRRGYIPLSPLEVQQELGRLQ